MSKASPDSGKLLLTKRQVASILHVDKRTIERKMASGELLFLNPTGGLVVFRKADLNAFIESGKQRSRKKTKSPRDEDYSLQNPARGELW